jgi:putative drug exporter of the RND superfamily
MRSGDAVDTTRCRASGRRGKQRIIAHAPEAYPSVTRETCRVLAAIGRTSARFRWVVVVGWIVLAVVGGTIGSRVFDRLSDTGGVASEFESMRAYDVLEQNSPYGPRIVALVDGRVQDPRVQAAVTAAAERLRGVPSVARVTTAYNAPLPNLRAERGDASLVAIDLQADLEQNQRHAAVDAIRRELQPLERTLVEPVRLGGTLLIYQDIAEQTERDLQRAELTAIPLTLAVMVVVFGGFLAATVPLAVAFVSIATAFVGLLAFSYLMELDPTVIQVTTVLGLGLAIDYGLLMVSRFREERHLGLVPAIERMNTYAGRTIAFSAVIVTVSLSGLFLFQSTIYKAIGAAAVSVVLLALAAALTLTPAMLAIFGHRMRMGVGRRQIAPPSPSTRVDLGETVELPTSNRPGSPRSMRNAAGDPLVEEGFFSRLARWVQRRAIPVVIVTAIALVALGIPFLDARYQLSGPALLPTSAESRQVADRISNDFPTGDVPAITIVARTDAATLAGYANDLAARPDVAGVEQVSMASAQVSFVDVFATAPGETSRALVRALRREEPGFETLVTGEDAILIDLGDEVRDRAPLALLFVGTGTFVLLFAMTGSVLIPLKALVMNTLSLGATFGVLVLVFQKGYGDTLLGFTATGALETWLPVITFAFAFGLSMDYEVFLISRIKEAYDSGLPNSEAVVAGLQRSGRIITSAALLILVVFLGFVAGRLISIKEIGLALSVAVVVDATVVRCLLVPATMQLLGDWNWWAPAPLRALHRRLGLAGPAHRVRP